MRRQRKEVDSDLNLLPIMNLFVALVPFLLVGTAFFHMSVLNVSVPTNSSETSVSSPSNKKKKIEVVMTIQITQKGFKVFGICEELSNKVLESFTKSFKKEKNYDFKSLSIHLAKIKKRYMKSHTVIIVPDKNIKYETIIQTIDAARKIKTKTKEIFMFTNVVVSSKV